MTFLLFPPEKNSGDVYTGPGSGALLAAATAWDELAGELSSTAAAVSGVVSGLNGTWRGPSAGALTNAMTPYLGWLQNTAGQALQLGAQAKVAAGLFETVRAAVVPPPVIEANRALLMALIATNFFGQNAAAIAAVEAAYAEFWAQDGAALDSYNYASQANLAAAPEPTSPMTVAKSLGQDSLASVQSLSSNVTNNVSNAAAALPFDVGSILDPGALQGALDGVANTVGQVPLVGSYLASQVASPTALMNAGAVPARFAMYPMSMLMQLARMGQMTGTSGLNSLAGTTNPLMEAIGQFVDGKLQTAVGTLASHFTSATQEISAKLGQAASLGSLRVPEAWSQLAQMGQGAIPRPIEALPTSLVNAPTMGSSAFPGGPFGQALMGALSGRGLSGVAAKVPKVIPKPTSG